MIEFHSSRRDSRDGIALVMVLGFLAVMVILAVSFSISMRTERIASSSYVEVARARQFIDVALTRAIEDYDSDLTGANLLYPDFVVKKSTDSGGSPLSTNIFVGGVTNFVPVMFHTSATAAHWLPIDDPDTGEAIGRFAYLIFDCSGFLDANFAGRSNRLDGADGYQISVADLYPPDVVSSNSFRTLTSTYKRFDGLRELALLGGASTWSGGNPRYFYVYSRFASNRVHNTPPTPVNSGGRIPLDVTDTVLNGLETNVEAKLTACGVPNPSEVFENLLDYVDADIIPNQPDNATALASFNTERVPMINEIVMSNQVVYTQVPDGSGGMNNVYTHNLYVTVETWYPFPTDSTVPFTINVAQPTIGVIPPGSPLTPVAIAPGPSPAFTPKAFSFYTNTFLVGTVAPVNPAPVIVGIAGSTLGAITVTTGGSTVDSVTYGPAFPNLNVVSFTPADPVGSKKGSSEGISVIDPRMNYNSTHWAGAGLTLGQVNLNATGAEGPSTMFVRDGPVSNVAELGFLSVGSPWRTIALYNNAAGGGNPLHPVLDYFSGVDERKIRRGLVNINTPFPEVLTAVLNNAPIQDYPGGPVLAALEAGAAVAQQADEIAANIKSLTTLPTGQNVAGSSVIGKTTGLANLKTALGLTDSQVESVIANTHRLFRYRQNLFLVVMAAQAGKDRDNNRITDSEVTADQRAVALVWRDPVDEDGDGYYPTFVRFFKWIYE
ncbi:MAG: hypothetical protein KJ626_05375 [Verrucomicrobia bacterium]|nr:hypothetical protein [Verrucomicrobiota bacterium]